ncbi:MAG: TetR/AcrR family transcriptional regulator [Caulobacteraceae bacterium]|nr:TetR/AcrR family transcriptional regulator [Caulobacteraceae bacterium]
MSVAELKPVRSARKPKGEGHARRGEILAAAEKIFVECGCEGATIRKIADEVGVSSTALYMHFRDKSEILHEICESAFDKLLKTDLAIIERPIPAGDKVRAILEAYMNFGFDNPNAYRLVFMTRPQEAGAAEIVAQRLGKDVFDRFQAVVEQLAEEGQLKVDPVVASQTLWAGSHGVVALIITKPYFDWAARKTLVRTMLDTLFEGLTRL